MFTCHNQYITWLKGEAQLGCHGCQKKSALNDDMNANENLLGLKTEVDQIKVN